MSASKTDATIRCRTTLPPCCPELPPPVFDPLSLTTELWLQKSRSTNAMSVNPERRKLRQIRSETVPDHACRTGPSSARYAPAEIGRELRAVALFFSAKRESAVKAQSHSDGELVARRCRRIFVSSAVMPSVDRREPTCNAGRTRCTAQFVISKTAISGADDSDGSRFLARHSSK